MSEHHFLTLMTLMTFHFLERLTAIIVVLNVSVNANSIGTTYFRCTVEMRQIWICEYG
jgi:hypothetical protein